jgi:hypothetical protein
MVIMPKMAGTLRYMYPECRASLKVFNSPHSKMALYGYNMSTTSKVMYSMQGFFGVPNETGNVTTLMGLILLPLKP